MRESPGGPVVRILHFHCWGWGSNPPKILQAANHGQKEKSRGEKENGYWGWRTISARVYIDLPHFQNWNFFYSHLSSGKWEPVTKPLVLHFQIAISKFFLRCVIGRATIQLQGRLGIWVLISRLRGEICDRRISPNIEMSFRIWTIPLIKDSYIHWTNTFEY